MITPNHSLDEAAALLKCSPRYLEDNLKRLPHQRIGKARVFSDAQLEAIQAMHSVAPETSAPEAPELTLVPQYQQLKEIRPKGRRRSG